VAGLVVAAQSWQPFFFYCHVAVQILDQPYVAFSPLFLLREEKYVAPALFQLGGEDLDLLS